MGMDIFEQVAIVASKAWQNGELMSFFQKMGFP
jgi:hypothetical protein